jgi:hypothetical protein
MSELICTHHTHILTSDGMTFIPRTVAARTDEGRWEAWLEFHPGGDDMGPILRTERETTQSNRAAVTRWAAGLEPVYFEGAFARAHVVAAR